MNMLPTQVGVARDSMPSASTFHLQKSKQNNTKCWENIAFNVV